MIEEVVFVFTGVRWGVAVIVGVCLVWEGVVIGGVLVWHCTDVMGCGSSGVGFGPHLRRSWWCEVLILTVILQWGIRSRHCAPPRFGGAHKKGGGTGPKWLLFYCVRPLSVVCSFAGAGVFTSGVVVLVGT